MRRLPIAMLMIVACGRGPASSPGPATPVIIDGQFGDWSGRPVATAAGGWSIRERSDRRYVYLELELPEAANLLGYPTTVSLEFEAGASFELDFAPSNGQRITEGVILRATHDGRVVRTTDSYAVDLVMLPTYRASRVELRLARGTRPDSVTPAFTGTNYRARLVVHDSAGETRLATPRFTAQLPPIDTAHVVSQATDPLARTAGTQFRALVWNVANEGIKERPDRFRKVIAANDPDLLILNEVGGVIGAEGVRKFLETLPRRGTWEFTYGGGGGYQRTVIASRNPVLEFPEFRRISFPDSLVARWFPQVPAANRENQRHNIDDGVATGGAAVTIAGKRVAIFGVDLQSAGNRLGAWQETRRQSEAAIVRDVGSTAIRAHGPFDGVILGGDHNLVGTREPLTIDTQLGRAFDGRPLDVAEPLQLDGSTAATWDGSSGPFPPGRLDWFTYSGARLEVLHSYVFEVADLSERWRTAHGLEVDDSKRSSDHRPIIVDLRWR